MSFTESIKITGDVTITVFDSDGAIKNTQDIPNLVVTTGKNHIASRIAGIFTGEGAPISHMGIGTSTTTPTLSDTSILSALGARVVISSMNHTAAINTIVVVASFSGYAGSITEAGMFNALTGGTMICRTTFGAVPVISGDTTVITWTLKIN
jgi:hypothetical protein